MKRPSESELALTEAVNGGIEAICLDGSDAVADIILKLKMLRLYSFSFHDWYQDVWKQDADAQMCCSGYMCGCYGSCYYEMWEAMLNRQKGSA